MLRVLSLGAGVQSTTLALMAAHGEIGPMPDCAMAVVRDLAEWHERTSAADGDEFLNGDSGNGRCGHDEIEALGERAKALAALDATDTGEAG